MSICVEVCMSVRVVRMIKRGGGHVCVCVCVCACVCV